MAPEIMERYLTVSEADELVNKAFLLGSPEMVFGLVYRKKIKKKTLVIHSTIMM